MRYLAWVRLSQMNGRIYDPTLGRFLQADPFIQAPLNSQNYNRYSYVLNNPLSYTDPTGYFFSKLFRAIAKVPILNAAINVGLNFAPGCQIWCSAAFSAATTYAVTGSLKAAFTSGAIVAASAYAFSQIGAHFDGLNAGMAGDGLHNFGGNFLTSGQIAQQITAHAFVGGVSSSIQGGKFGHGFLSAGITKGIGGAFLPGGKGLSPGQIVKGTVISAVIGGTTSKISGGKFANGAQTGAFQYLFNQVAENYPFGKETEAAFADNTPDHIRDMEGEVANILLNAAKGAHAEELAADYFRNEHGAEVMIHGLTVVVEVNGEMKYRYPDLGVKFPDGSIAFVEVKSGMARLNRQQILADQVIQTSGGYVYSSNPNIIPSGVSYPINVMLTRVFWKN